MYALNDASKVFIFTGPDGSGRKTIADMVGTTLEIRKVLSYTTRAPRASEVEGQDYRFISFDDFALSQDQGEFVESVQIDGVCYGIKYKDIEKLLQTNGNVYVIINGEGASMLKKRFGENAVTLFIYIEKGLIRQRQLERGYSEEAIRACLAHYDDDMAYLSDSDHAVENTDLAHTVFAVTNIMEQYLQRDLVDKD